MTAKEIAKLAVAGLEDKKGGNVRVLEIGEISTLGDYFVLGEGTSNTQVKALADSVDFFLSREGIEPHRIEGYQTGNWILLDYGDVIVHVFHREAREFYNLERLWADGTLLEQDGLS